MTLANPVSLLLEVNRILAAAQIRFATYGGLALALYGVPRFTQDADIALAGDSFNAAVSALRARFELSLIGLEQQHFGGLTLTRVTVFDEREEANTVDLIAPRDPVFATALLDRAITGSLRGESIQVVSPEDFILLKVLSTRDQDLIDAATVLKKMADHLESGFLEKELERLALLFPNHPIRERWQKIKA